MTAKVYFANMKAGKKSESLLEKVNRLFYKAGFHEFIKEEDLIALKLHFGEMGNTAFIRPIYVRRIVEEIKKLRGKPFLTDANTLYVGSRANSVDHLETAIANGFGYSTVKAPIIIADGLTGKNFTEVEVNGKHFSHVKIGTDVLHADSIIGISHFKGHELTGFGGTLKNIGMGLGSRAGKQMMHSAVKPRINQEICRKCHICKKWCPAQAITISPDVSEINHDICIGCAECTVSCPHGAIKISWSEEGGVAQEKIVEFAIGVLKDKKDRMGFFNFVMDISPLCDCCSWSDMPVVHDVGILASKDPVAIDQAAYDLVNKQEGIKGSALKENFAPGEDKFRGVHPDMDPTVQLKYGENMGLGTRKYELIEVD